MNDDVFAERMRNKSPKKKKKRDPAGIRTQLIGVVVCSEMADISLSLSRPIQSTACWTQVKTPAKWWTFGASPR